jgi:hypothetical protein
MSRKPLPLGSWGKITVERSNGSYRARGRYRDYDGTTRQVEASGKTKGGRSRASAARIVGLSHSSWTRCGDQS